MTELERAASPVCCFLPREGGGKIWSSVTAADDTMETAASAADTAPSAGRRSCTIITLPTASFNHRKFNNAHQYSEFHTDCALDHWTY